MTDLIPLDAEIAAFDYAWTHTAAIAALRAIPTIDPAAIREAALKEAAAVVASCTWSEYWIYDGDYVEPLHLSDCIIALIGEKK